MFPYMIFIDNVEYVLHSELDVFQLTWFLQDKQNDLARMLFAA